MRFIILDVNNKIVAIREGKSIVEGEIQSDTGELGQIMQPDGTFIDDSTPIPPPEPTLEEQVAQLKADNLILMDALATTFEEILILEGQISLLGGTPA